MLIFLCCHSDGVGQDQLSCLKEFRNRPHAVRLRIIRAKGTLEVGPYSNTLVQSVILHPRVQVWVHEGLSQRDEDYDLCGMISSTASIPSAGYFGISAATGGLSDDHDVLSFVAHSLTPLDEAKVLSARDILYLHQIEKVIILSLILHYVRPYT